MLPFLPLLRFATFHGRASRGEYWSFMLLQGVAIIACLGLAVVSLTQGAEGFLGFVGWLIGALLILMICAIPNYAVLARRLHDTGRPARWMALLLPGILNQYMTFQAMGRAVLMGARGGAASGEAAMTSALATQSGGLAMITLVASLCSLALFVMTLMPGTKGPNVFGHDPRDPDAEAPTSGPSGWSGDEARLDDLFAKARKESRQAESPYKPVFDFGPGPLSPPPAEPPRAVDWNRPAWDPGVTPARTFGRRGS